MVNYLLITGLLALLYGERCQALKNQTCSSSPCDLQCIDNGICVQSCDSTPCKMACKSGQVCKQTCVQGGCKKMACESDTICALECSKGNCKEMSCKSPKTSVVNCGSNCDITCYGPCQPYCTGPGCRIKCKTKECSVTCEQGHCNVHFAQGSSGSVYCLGGNCTVLCPLNGDCKMPICIGNSCTKTFYIPKTRSAHKSHFYRQTSKLAEATLLILGLLNFIF